MPSKKRKASAIKAYTSQRQKVAKYQANNRTFINLPNEIITLISECLPQVDLNSLCLVNRHCLAVVERTLYIKDAVNEYSESLLWSAIHNSPATTRKAVSAGAKIDGWKAKPHPKHPVHREDTEAAERDPIYGNRARVPLAHCDQSPLFIAAYQGHLDVCKILLSNGAAPGWKTPWENYMTPASAAAAKGHLKVLVHLHDLGYDLPGDRCYHGTVLHSAVHHGRARVVEFLVNTAGINIAEKNGKGLTALALSVSSQPAAILRCLLKMTPPKDPSITEALSQVIERCHPNFADIILDSNKIDWSHTTRSGETLLVQTIQQDRPYFLNLLLERGRFNLNVRSSNGLTLLMQARQNPGYRGALLEILLKSDKISLVDKIAMGEEVFFENLRRSDCDKLLALLLKEGLAGDDHVAHLHGAASHGKHKIIRLLVEDFGVPVDAKMPNGCTALKDAFLRQDSETTKCLCELGASSILRGLDFLPMLHHAARYGPVPMIRALLGGGVDPNKTTPGSEQSALHFACASGNLDRVTALLNNGADRMLRDADGLTAYHLAARTGRQKLVKWLLSGRRHPDPLLQEGPTLLHEACRGGNVPIAKLLLKRKCNIEARTDRGETALHIAVAQSNLGIVQLLLSSGADTLAEDKDGSTPVSLAAKTGNDEIRNALQQKKAQFRSPIHIDKIAAEKASGVQNGSDGEERQLRRSSRCRVA
ncbi:Ankyrin repeat-containing domain protein [Akanthomyces lecanii RCEF 1005]|uniref:Ankyrin repeat-containing domain protein n=1 Tax=Akanthomyces lecanii RCEF 1005 TaxID=1081108 RepID=A0A168D0I3_CORDF|nr:Ankyrin repeat-containing domain protein [Akanthomyces lecanii RCEF 1005]